MGHGTPSAHFLRQRENSRAVPTLAIFPPSRPVSSRHTRGSSRESSRDVPSRPVLVLTGHLINGVGWPVRSPRDLLRKFKRVVGSSLDVEHHQLEALCTVRPSLGNKKGKINRHHH